MLPRGGSFHLAKIWYTYESTSRDKWEEEGKEEETEGAWLHKSTK